MLVAAAVAALALASSAAADTAYTFPNMSVTYYYDNTLGMHDECNAVSGGFDWSFPTNLGSTACGPSVMEMHTNSLVAMNVTWLNLANPGRANLCGREVEILRDGKPVPPPGGKPWFLWEGCQACTVKPIVDLSVSGYIAVTGDKTCQRGSVGGFEVRVLDNYIHRAGAGRLAVERGVVALAVIAVAAVFV